MMKFSALFFFFFIFILGSVGESFAQESKGVTISPAYSEISLDKIGEEKEFEITLTNDTDQSILLEVFAVDFKQQDEYGRIGFVGKDAQYSYSLASFLSLPQSEVSLDPFSSQKIEVQVTNREDLSPGGHYAAVVARLKTDQESVSDEQTTIAPSVSSLILLKKNGGERYNLSYIRSSWPESLVLLTLPKRFDLLLQNEGNIHVVPYGRVEVRDMSGRLLADGQINPSSRVILPESRRWVDGLLTELEKPSPFSINVLTVSGYDAGKKAQFLYKETFITIDPIPLSLICAFIVIFAILMIRKRRRKK